MGIQFDFESADQSSRVADRGQRSGNVFSGVERA